MWTWFVVAAAWADRGSGTVLPEFQEAPAPLPAGTDPESPPATDPGTRRRPFLHEINLRGRWLAVPDFVIDPFAYGGDDVHPETGEVHPERPAIRAMAFGLEYVLNRAPLDGIFYFEYMPNLTEGGYWDDVETNTPNFDDGDWVQPVDVVFYNLGANFAFEAAPTPVLHLFFATGLGIAFRTGEFQDWNSTPEAPAWQVYTERPDQPDEILAVPRVLPLVDISAGIKLDFAGRASLRLEGGIHDMFFLGAALGATI